MRNPEQTLSDIKTKRDALIQAIATAQAQLAQVETRREEIIYRLSEQGLTPETAAVRADELRAEVETVLSEIQESIKW